MRRDLIAHRLLFWSLTFVDYSSLLIFKVFIFETASLAIREAAPVKKCVNRYVHEGNSSNRRNHKENDRFRKQQTRITLTLEVYLSPCEPSYIHKYSIKGLLFRLLELPTLVGLLLCALDVLLLPLFDDAIAFD